MDPYNEWVDYNSGDWVETGMTLDMSIQYKQVIELDPFIAS